MVPPRSSRRLGDDPRLALLGRRGKLPLVRLEIDNLLSRPKLASDEATLTPDPDEMAELESIEDRRSYGDSSFSRMKISPSL
jgi:hypothetical protein